MTIKELIEKSFVKHIIIPCPDGMTARYFLTTYWYNHYSISFNDIVCDKRIDMQEQKRVKNNTISANSAIESYLNSWNCYGTATCFNIKDGLISPISMTYINKYGLQYPYTIVNNSEIERR